MAGVLARLALMFVFLAAVACGDVDPMRTDSGADAGVDVPRATIKVG